MGKDYKRQSAFLEAKVVENSLPKPVDYRRTPGLNYMVHLNISYRFSRAVEVMAKFGGLSQKYRFKGLYFLFVEKLKGWACQDGYWDRTSRRGSVPEMKIISVTCQSAVHVKNKKG